MRKFLFTLSVLLGMMIMFPSCKSQMERDAEKMAKRGVELEEVMHRMERQKNDRSNLYGKGMSDEEYDQFARDYIEFANKLHQKYSETPEMKEEFYKLVEEKTREIKNK